MLSCFGVNYVCLSCMTLGFLTANLAYVHLCSSPADPAHCLIRNGKNKNLGCEPDLAICSLPRALNWKGLWGKKWERATLRAGSRMFANFRFKTPYLKQNKTKKQCHISLICLIVLSYSHGRPVLFILHFTEELKWLDWNHSASKQQNPNLNINRLPLNSRLPLLWDMNCLTDIIAPEFIFSCTMEIHFNYVNWNICFKHRKVHYSQKCTCTCACIHITERHKIKELAFSSCLL